jgi:hypothetical protein
MYDAQSLLSSLGQRGIQLEADEGSLIAQPASKLTDQDRELIRQLKPALLNYLRAVALAREAEAAGRDLVDDLREHPDLRDAPEDGRLSAAESLITTCARYGISLKLDADGGLIIGRSDLNGAEPALWESLIMAIEVHLPAVERLVAAGWHLSAKPKIPNAA